MGPLGYEPNALNLCANSLFMIKWKGRARFELATYRAATDRSATELTPHVNTQEDNVAEWLRRQPAKLMGFARVGSNPIVVVFFFCVCEHE